MKVFWQKFWFEAFSNWLPKDEISSIVGPKLVKRRNREEFYHIWVVVYCFRSSLL